jgi:hypothetical protein
VFAGFDDAGENEQFNRRVAGVTHTWCCFVNGTVDHPMPPFDHPSPTALH